MLDLTALEAALAETIFAGNLHFSPITGSTNADALEAARAGAAHGSVYFADEQLAGRGRGDHTWHSPAGEGLYVSVLLRPPMPARRLPLLPLAAGLAAADAIRAVSGLKIDLRWPNDLLVSSQQDSHLDSGPRKTGGILVEAKSEGSNVAFAVVGIGINVHQRRFAPGLATPATSLDLEASHLEASRPGDRSKWLEGNANRRIRRQDLLVALLKSLERETLGLLDPAARETIPQRVERASTWVRGRQVEVHGPQACTGLAAGLDEDGFLLVRTADGLVTVQTGGIRARDSR